MIPTGNKRRGPDARAPDWHADPAKYAAKMEQDKRERGELVVALGPFCVPCGKRFAKQSVYDAHLAGKKHLAALQRMGRAEEAMVCQLDMEAKRRRLAEAEQAKQDSWRSDTRQGVPAEESAERVEAEAARRAAREEALRQRALLPMPETVIATSVYGHVDELEGAGAGTEGDEGNPHAPSAEDADRVIDEEQEPSQVPAALPEVPYTGCFIPAVTFEGARPGMIFKMGTLGCGYYDDPQYTASPVAATAADRREEPQIGCEEATP